MSHTADHQRLDQWLWQARFFKTRGLAGRLCRTRRVRRNGRLVNRPSTCIKPGNVLTFPQGPRIRVVRVLGLAKRRGPAREAATLYQDLSPPSDSDRATVGTKASGITRDRGSGRPTKRQRRALDRLRRS